MSKIWSAFKVADRPERVCYEICEQILGISEDGQLK
jgi:hypothetical protein